MTALAARQSAMVLAVFLAAAFYGLLAWVL